LPESGMHWRVPISVSAWGCKRTLNETRDEREIDWRLKRLI